LKSKEEQRKVWRIRKRIYRAQKKAEQNLEKIKREQNTEPRVEIKKNPDRVPRCPICGHLEPFCTCSKEQKENSESSWLRIW